MHHLAEGGYIKSCGLRRIVAFRVQYCKLTRAHPCDLCGYQWGGNSCYEKLCADGVVAGSPMPPGWRPPLASRDRSPAPASFTTFRSLHAACSQSQLVPSCSTSAVSGTSQPLRALCCCSLSCAAAPNRFRWPLSPHHQRQWAPPLHLSMLPGVL